MNPLHKGAAGERRSPSTSSYYHSFSFCACCRVCEPSRLLCLLHSLCLRRCRQEPTLTALFHVQRSTQKYVQAVMLCIVCLLSSFMNALSLPAMTPPPGTHASRGALVSACSRCCHRPVCWHRRHGRPQTLHHTLLQPRRLHRPSTPSAGDPRCSTCIIHPSLPVSNPMASMAVAAEFAA